MTYKKPNCSSASVSIRVLQQYVKTQHLGNFTTSDLYYNRFLQLGKPSVYHTPRRSRLQFYDVIFSLVIIRLSRSWSLEITEYTHPQIPQIPRWHIFALKATIKCTQKLQKLGQTLGLSNWPVTDQTRPKSVTRDLVPTLPQGSRCKNTVSVTKLFRGFATNRHILINFHPGKTARRGWDISVLNCQEVSVELDRIFFS